LNRKIFNISAWYLFLSQRQFTGAYFVNGKSSGMDYQGFGAYIDCQLSVFFQAVDTAFSDRFMS
jgi:hypothetical protein